MIRRLLRRWLGIEAKSPIDDTLSYQNRKLAAMATELSNWSTKYKAADAARLASLERRILRLEVDAEPTRVPTPDETLVWSLMPRPEPERLSPAELRALRRVPAEERP